MYNALLYYHWQLFEHWQIYLVIYLLYLFWCIPLLSIMMKKRIIIIIIEHYNYEVKVDSHVQSCAYIALIYSSLLLYCTYI